LGTAAIAVSSSSSLSSSSTMIMTTLSFESNDVADADDVDDDTSDDVARDNNNVVMTNTPVSPRNTYGSLLSLDSTTTTVMTQQLQQQQQRHDLLTFQYEEYFSSKVLSSLQRETSSQRLLFESNDNQAALKYCSDFTSNMVTCLLMQCLGRPCADGTENGTLLRFVCESTTVSYVRDTCMHLILFLLFPCHMPPTCPLLPYQLPAGDTTIEENEEDSSSNNSNAVKDCDILEAQVCGALDLSCCPPCAESTTALLDCLLDFTVGSHCPGATCSTTADNDGEAAAADIVGEESENNEQGLIVNMTTAATTTAPFLLLTTVPPLQDENSNDNSDNTTTEGLLGNPTNSSSSASAVPPSASTLAFPEQLNEDEDQSESCSSVVQNTVECIVLKCAFRNCNSNPGGCTFIFIRVNILLYFEIRDGKY